MKKLAQKVTLRFTVPFILVMFAVVSIGNTVLVELPALKRNFEANAYSQVAQMLNFLQSRIDLHLRSGNMEGARHETSIVGSRSDVAGVILLDESMRPVASNQYALLHRFEKRMLTPADWNLLKKALQKMHTVLEGYPGEFQIHGAVPIIFGHTEDSFRADKVGALLIHLDYRASFIKNRDLIYHQLAIQMGVLFGISIFIGLLFFYLLNRPALKLQQVATEFSKGHYTARYKGSAPGELGTLAKSFNLMAENIEQTHIYLRAILDSQPHIVVINDGQKLIDANDAFFQLFPEFDNVKEFQKKHHCICEFFESTDEPNFLTEIVNGKNWIDTLKDEPDIYHKVMIKREGKPVIFSVHLGVVQLAGLMRNIVSFNDITELETIQKNLEIRVEQELKTRSDLEEKMINQSKMAQMGEMVTMISHHWRQPLNVISIAVQNLKDDFEYGILDEKVLDDTERIVMESTQHLSETLSTLSAYMGRMHDKRAFDASKAAKKMFDLVESELTSGFIKCDFKCDEAIILYGEPTFFGQILHHLIKNAQEAMMDCDKNSRKIRGQFIKQNEKQAVLSVWDNGIGIDEKILPRLFEPFFTTKEVANKTGLGLYIVKMMVEQQFNGSIEVHNRQTTTEFCITFPLATNAWKV